VAALQKLPRVEGSTLPLLGDLVGRFNGRASTTSATGSPASRRPRPDLFVPFHPPPAACWVGDGQVRETARLTNRDR
jgi:hypothetical protein